MGIKAYRIWACITSNRLELAMPETLIPGYHVRFDEWIHSLSDLRTFWTKRVENFMIASEEPLALLVSWKARRGCREAFFLVTNHRDHINEFIASARSSRGGDVCYILVTELELELGLYDRWSVVYVYTMESRLLEPNQDVGVEAYENPSGRLLAEVERVQRGSWGFYAPPRPGSVVLLARLGSEAVGVAYYHPGSSNIDYGVHVAREYWRRRIGTRLLHEVRKYAQDRGKSWLTVVRVVRGRKPTAADRRAMAFYEANNPQVKLNVYRIKTP